MNWEQTFAKRIASTQRNSVREFLKRAREPGFISFAGGLPTAELFPVEKVKEASERVLTRSPARALQYAETEGLPELREWIAQAHSHSGRSFTPENVLIVCGAQQGLDVLGRVLFNEGDRVLVEDPTYLALLSAWRTWGVTFKAAEGDDLGLIPEKLSSGVKAAYLTPNFQNPAGRTLPFERRQAVVEWAERNQILIVEDNPYGELRYEGEDLPNLLHCAPQETPIIYAGTFSKVLCPGFRVGYLIGPREVIEKCTRAKQSMDLHTSAWNQSIVFELISMNFMAEHIRTLRTAYKQKRDAMLAAMERWLSGEMRWNRPEGGMFIWAELRNGLEPEDLLRACLEEKVGFVPGKEFSVNGRSPGLRLNFTNPTLEQIERGLEKIAVALRRMGEKARPIGAAEAASMLSRRAQPTKTV